MSDKYLQFQLHLSEFENLDRRLAYIKRERESHRHSMQLLYPELSEKQKQEVEAYLEENGFDLVFLG
jgi:hypothetical protein